LQEPQKLYLYGFKTNLIGTTPPNIDDFINYQIEQSYLKIEKKLQECEYYINLLKVKISNTEDVESKLKTIIVNHKKVEVEKCPQMLADGFCVKMSQWRGISSGEARPCQYCHTPMELDLVRKEQTISNCLKSISFI